MQQEKKKKPVRKSLNFRQVSPTMLTELSGMGLLVWYFR